MKQRSYKETIDRIMDWEHYNYDMYQSPNMSTCVEDLMEMAEYQMLEYIFPKEIKDNIGNLYGVFTDGCIYKILKNATLEDIEKHILRLEDDCITERKAEVFSVQNVYDAFLSLDFLEEKF